MKRKEHLKKLLIELINRIDDEDIYAYLYVFIMEKFKKGED